MIDPLAIWLNLTPDQKTRAADLLNKSEADFQPLIKVQKKAAEDFVGLLAKPNATEQELTDAAIKAQSAEQALLLFKVKELVALRGLLTTQQNEALSTRLEHWSAPWRQVTSQPKAIDSPPAAPVLNQQK